MKLQNLSAVLTLILCSSFVTGQQKIDKYWEEGPSQCQFNSAFLDGISQDVGHDQMAVVVAHLGKDETNIRLNQRRLHNVLVFWTEFSPRLKPQDIKLVEGERVEGYGRLEFFVGNKLDGVLKIKHDADLFVGACYPPDDSYIKKHVYDACRVKSEKRFYPCFDTYQRKRKS